MIHLDRFGLQKAPFGPGPEAGLFHGSPARQRVIDWIEDGVGAHARILVLTGAAGTGKTTLLNLLPDRYGSEWVIGLVPGPLPESGGILAQARRALDLPDQGGGPDMAARQIRRFSATIRASNGFVLLVVDEAQALDPASLSALAALTGGTARDGALTLLLVGRPGLLALLDAPELQDLRPGDAERASLPPFSEAETAAYVAHRLAQAGRRTPLFDPGAMQVLHGFSQGVPGSINIMAEHCLKAAAAQGLSRIESGWIRAVLEEATATGMDGHAGEPEGAASPEVAPLPRLAAPAAPAENADHPALPVAAGPEPAVEQSEERMEEQAAPADRSASPSPDARADAPRPLPAPYPLPLSPGPSRRRGLWVPVAAAVAAVGAAFLWLQAPPGPAPMGKGLALPAANAAVEQAAPRPGPGLAPVAVTPDPTVEALMRQALEVETRDPAGAALAYARAALRGQGRAAYYLGQLHETAAGAGLNPGLARLWYAAAPLPAARQRMQDLTAPAAAGPPDTPVPIFQARLDSGASEMIWHVPKGAAPVRFRVEVRGLAGQALPAQETTVPGLILPLRIGAWRVTAIGAGGAESTPSDMVRMIPAEEGPSGEGRP
ncbi:ExeA family protein [Paracoccus chinensis]|uniref:ExeA family protein n=1 Tax=Paracoccus chinensis TaxID=525640 RepID=UPI001C31387B|nr:AAA family ATPase [Paracoccus chinensis]